MKCFAQSAIVAIVTLAACGCVSTGAQVARTEFAIESEIKNRDNADAQRRLALHHIEQNSQREIERLQQVLDAQNQRAGQNVQRVAQNYIDYYAAMDELRRRVSAEHEKVATLNAEQLALGKGYRVLSSMADEELRVSRETANAAITEAIKTADDLWKQYQEAQHPPLPTHHNTTPDVETNYH